MTNLPEILDELTTTIHNLSPGDVGSMDRVLRPIKQSQSLIYNELLKVIGEDEELITPENYEKFNKNNVSIFYTNRAIETRNNLRSKQRFRLQEFCFGPDNLSKENEK